MTADEARAVRLDEDTDAGEFMYQTLFHVDDADNGLHTVLTEDPELTPESVALLADTRQITRWMNALDEYGMEFEGMWRRREFERYQDYRLAESGVESARKFLAAVLTLLREA